MEIDSFKQKQVIFRRNGEYESTVPLNQTIYYLCVGSFEGKTKATIDKVTKDGKKVRIKRTEKKIGLWKRIFS